MQDGQVKKSLNCLIRAFAGCLNIIISMNIKLLTEHHLEFLSLKWAAQASLSLHLSKCHIVGSLMSRLIYFKYTSREGSFESVHLPRPV